jgi:molecular chaperone GrpE
MTEQPHTPEIVEEEGAAEEAAPAPDDGASRTTLQPPEQASPEGEQAAVQRVAEDLEALTAKAAERDEYLALAQRTQADFENYRKRMSKEVGAAEARGTAKLAKELLPALDNLARALDAATPEDEHLAEGIRLVQQDLRAALARLRIEPFSPKGERFDPNEHEAVAQQPIEGAEPGTVAEVYQEGYRHGETVLRPARVVVAG